MAQSIKLADEIMALVRREADARDRSLVGQITHWLKLGCAVERSGAYDHARAVAALEGRLDTRALTEEEGAVWLDVFTDAMGRPSDAERAFYAERRALGRGVGLDAGGALVRACDDGKPSDAKPNDAKPCAQASS